jgi:hypothetical protein
MVVVQQIDHGVALGLFYDVVLYFLEKKKNMVY